MIKGVIFDMDGVLIDTELQSNLGWLWAADINGIAMPMSLMDSFKGAPPALSATYFAKYYKDLGRSDLDYWKLRDQRTEHVYKIRETEDVPSKKGVLELLKYLKKNDIKCAVATSTQKSSAVKSLNRIGAYEYLSGVVYGDEVEHGKPEPDIFLRAAEIIGVRPEECIVVEDSINGVKAGRRAGMTVVHIPDTIEFTEEHYTNVDYVCETLLDIPGIIEKLNKSDIDSASDNIDDARDANGAMDYVNGAMDDVSVVCNEINVNKKPCFIGNPSVNYLFVDRVHVRNTFAEYVKKYNIEDPKIELKASHTYRVAALCEQIARSAGLSAYDVEIAWLSGMLHDIGRFEQVKQFNTFLDSKSVDHAQFGADILFEQGLIKAFTEGYAKCRQEEYRVDNAGSKSINKSRYSKDYRLEYLLNKSDMNRSKDNEDGLNELEVLELVIRVHNKFRIPENVSDRIKNLCNVLRDADKVDILRVNVETGMEKIYDVTTEVLLNSPISEEVELEFYKNGSVFRDHIKTPLDHLVGHLSLVFELVFPESVKEAKRQGYLDKMLSFESNNEETKERFARIVKHMRKVIGD